MDRFAATVLIACLKLAFFALASMASSVEKNSCSSERRLLANVCVCQFACAHVCALLTASKLASASKTLASSVLRLPPARSWALPNIVDARKAILAPSASREKKTAFWDIAQGSGEAPAPGCLCWRTGEDGQEKEESPNQKGQKDASVEKQEGEAATSGGELLRGLPRSRGRSEETGKYPPYS